MAKAIKGAVESVSRHIQCLACETSGTATWSQNAEPQKNNGRYDRRVWSVPEGFKTGVAPRVGEGQTVFCKNCEAEALGVG